ncbi:MAG TPA: BON domain-containing protein [Burkholderiales bacterium]|nr:BON domain-containing protein [Burkholderiales bacterium]
MRKLLTLFALLGALCTVAPAHAGFWADHALAVKVSTKLQFNKKLLRTVIQVEAHDGNVMLSGSVPSQELIDEAVRAAKAVEGVRSVKSYLKVGPSDASGQ